LRRHRAPFTRQPLGGWQIAIPVGPYGAQTRLQQKPQLSQTAPSMPPLLQRLDVDGSAPQ
jgi:hypothetical protein